MTSWPIVTRLCLRTLLPKGNSRQYVAKVSRIPKRIFTKEGVIENIPNRSKPAQNENIPGDEEVSKNILEEPPSIIPPGFPRFERKGKDDTELCRMGMDTSCRKAREKSRIVKLEGKRLIKEALLANAKLQALFFSRLEHVIPLPLPPTPFIFQKITYQKLKRWSDVDTPSGILGFFKIPEVIREKKSSLPFSIICDNIRDPGNLGSVLRVAASAGCKRVLLTRGCVDLWSGKVLRSAMGSHFHICTKENLTWDQIQETLEPNSRLVYADNKVHDFSGQDDVDPGSTLEDEKGEENSIEEPNDTALSLNSFPVFPYYQVAYSELDSFYLVVGGETKGFSEEAIQLGMSHQGFRVNIPMMNNVESLNVSSAVAILTHEIKRQYEINHQMLMRKLYSIEETPSVSDSVKQT